METHVYNENGWKAEAEILSEETGAMGTTIRMRIIKTHMRPEHLAAETIPKDGDIFVTYRSHSTKIQSWTLGGQ